MTKSGVAEGAALDGGRTAVELKKELRRLVKAIVEDDDGRAETYEKAGDAIATLKELRASGGGVGGGGGVPGGKGSSPPSEAELKKKHEQRLGKVAPDSLVIPTHFICPLSSDIMKDPVILANGETYDRAYIQEWLNSGNRTCPQTQQVLSSTILTPNLLVRSMISRWCADNDVDLPKPVNPDTEGLCTASERSRFSALLADLSSPAFSNRKQAVKSLRQFTKRSRSYRVMFGEDPGAISQLLSILSDAGDDQELREDLVTAVLNLSIDDSNKKSIGESNGLALLIQSLNISSGTMNMMGNAAAALFTLSALDSNKVKIGELGAIPPLIELFETGSPAAKKDAASAIFNLCLLNENKVRAVKAGALNACLAEITNSSSAIIDESMALLALLSADQEAAEEMADSGGVPVLLKVLREGGSAKNKENAVVMLYAICSIVRRKLKEVEEEERLHGTISKLASGGTSRAKRKATGILDKLKRLMHSPHYSC